MEIMVLILVVLLGLYLLIGTLFRWDWMYQNRQAKAIIQVFGMKGARIVYGAIGLILVLGVPVVRVLRWIDLYQKNVPDNRRTTVQPNPLVEPTPDLDVTLSVEPDGCTVTRTEVTGSSSTHNLQWTVTNQNGEVVLSRLADEEYRYTYFRPGMYNVVLQTWHNGEYIDIGNQVIIACGQP